MCRRRLLKNSGQAGSGALEFTLSGERPGKERFTCGTILKQKDQRWHGTAGDLNVNVSYGNRILTLPFSLTLDDFIIERYPGSNSPSGFKSRVTLTDKDHNADIKYDIYMNHILKHRGYRFYQSSYDKDELGTVLSVNHDPAGMIHNLWRLCPAVPVHRSLHNQQAVVLQDRKEGLLEFAVPPVRQH